MDYSQFQVKYIKNPDLQISNPFEQSFDNIEYEPIDISALKFDSAQADEPTAIIKQEVEQSVQKQKKKIKKVISKPLNIPASKGLDNFNRFYDQAISQYSDISKQLKDRRNLFTKIAQIESSFNSSIQNYTGAPAFGYFQFMEGLYNGNRHSNITKHAGVDINTFRNSPVLQMKAANSLANEFLSSFKPAELKRLHELGWSDNAIIGGCWLGGPGGVRKLIFRNIDSKDVSGTSVSSRMKMFNNI